MENSFTIVRDDDDTNEEWSSFCSSCKSILQPIYGSREPSFFDELINEPFEKKKINSEIDADESNNNCSKETELNQKFYEKADSVISNTLEHGIVLIKPNLSDKVVLYDESLRNLISLKKSQNIANYNTKKKILKLTKSILHLGNCINVMRKIILGEIHKRTTCVKESNDTMPRFCYSHNNVIHKK